MKLYNIRNISNRFRVWEFDGHLNRLNLSWLFATDYTCLEGTFEPVYNKMNFIKILA